MNQDFVHLNLHTEYSLVDGIVRIKKLAKKTADLGMGAIALADQSNLFAMVKFYKAMLGVGVKPIIGADLWISRDKDEPFKTIVLCKNLDGYMNLMRIISKGFTHGQQNDRAIIDFDFLLGRTDGLIALSGARDGEIGKELLAGNYELAQEHLLQWKELFPDDSYYIELQRTGREGENEYIHSAVRLACDNQIPLVATNNVCFLGKEDFEAHEARVCICDGYTLDDPKRPKLYSEEQYLRSPQEMIELFSDLPEAISNTVEIAKRCSLEVTLGKNFLPNFPVPEGLTIDDYLRQLSHQGLEERFEYLLDKQAADYEEKKKVYIDRLDIELDVIIQMGFPGYFLIVADFIQWAKDNDVPVGPGRGSGAGSLVAYALKITDLDPLEYDLLFERFLNPERVSMPDFDIDFCMDGRDRVIAYVAEKYGRDSVSQIATHGTMAAKAVIRDVGRVLGHPYGFVDRIAKLIPFRPGITINEAMDEEPELKEKYNSDDEVKYLIDLALKLEGVARNVGKHAGGVVISPSLLTDFSPLYCEADGTSVVTQYDKNDVEEVGLVKFDFLGLRTLTIIDWALKAINAEKKKNGEEPIDIAQIPLDDVESFDLLKASNTTAVFQLESSGMKDLIRRLQPDTFEDIVALVALYRPGPLESGMVQDFIDRKHGRAEVVYPHPDLEPVLKPTYGVILYQEQVMQIAQVLANYTLGGADMLRRAMGKKKPEEMQKQRTIFTEGALARDVEEDTATGIFDLMEKFAGYGFNKSHSAAYALVSYQTAWLKQHYVAPFMAAVLSSDMDNTDKVVLLIEDCREQGLKVLPPDVSSSDYMFRAKDDKTVNYGLGAIKGVGEGAIESIVHERKENGAYKDIFDFCKRVDLRKVNKRVLEALVCSGAMDSFGINRASLMHNLPEALQEAEQHSKAIAAGQNDLFGFDAPVVDDSSQGKVVKQIPEWIEAERLRNEKTTLGLFLTGHPITQFEGELKHFISKKNRDVLTMSGAAKGFRGPKGKNVLVAGMIVELRVRPGQDGSKMGFATLDDRTGRIEISVFNKVFEEYGEKLQNDQVVVAAGQLRYDEKREQNKIVVERIYTIEEAREHYARKLVISLFSSNAESDFVFKLKEVIEPFKHGACPVMVEYLREGARANLDFARDWAVNPTDELIQKLKGITSENSVRVEYP